MKPDILISVVIPAYNRSRTIAYCLESVLRQTYKNLDIVVVDDGSTDDTLDIVKALEDGRIRCIALGKRFGAQAARNRGIREARGNWVAFLDSDDEWVFDKIEKQVSMLVEHKENPHIVIHGDGIKYSQGMGEREIWHLPITEGEKSYHLLLSRPATLFPCILTSKKVLEEIGYLDESVLSYQEWDTSIRLAKCCTFVHIKDPLCIYYLHDGETISKDGTGDFLGYQYVIEKHKDQIITVCGLETWKAHLRGQYEKFFNLNIYEKGWRENTLILDALDTIFKFCHSDLAASRPAADLNACVLQRIKKRLGRCISEKATFFSHLQKKPVQP
jgi:glycosyltransferase involved in cell wall biosynthesis